MARFLSEEWVAAYNAALADAPPPPEDEDAAGFTVAQLVDGVPGRARPQRTLLVVEGGRARMELLAEDDETRADVTVSLPYPDAAALSRGELDPAAAVATGRIRVRGDLSALARGSATLARAGASPGLADLAAATTYD